MTFEYGIQGTLFRNLGHDTDISAGNVTLVQHFEVARGGLCEGWPCSVSVTVESADKATALRAARPQLDAFLDSLCLVGRDDDLQDVPLLKSSNEYEFRESGRPGQSFLSMPLRYNTAPIGATTLDILRTHTRQVFEKIQQASKNVLLAACWYSMAMSEDTNVDRFMKYWVAFDVLVPLKAPPNNFGTRRFLLGMERSYVC